MASNSRQTRRRITIERRLTAPIDAVWDLWTTAPGIECWWGPEGFQVKVHHLDLRPGGELHYDMTAIAPDQIDFLKKAGMPIRQPASLTYTSVLPQRHLGFRQLADFIPGVKPYEVEHSVDFAQEGAIVRMTLTLDAMHDEQWTKMAVMGWEQELGKLARLLQSR
ncbi:MAG TPA: SRPBCC domain-containing protein [Candidatus Dormibacteraeota bacterium]|nr:SRPBCC domain-containing protein [Candidatus Dormibacteraeota bacterium]